MVSKQRRKELLDRENVVAVGKGKKVKDGEETGEDAVKVFVSEKKSLDDLDDVDVVPVSVESTQTDVEEIGVPVVEFNPKERHRPFPMGSSIGHEDITAGTAGRIVWGEVSREFDDGSTTNVVEPQILTNNHVAANANSGEVGDDITQPGPLDAKNPKFSVVGKLNRYVTISDKDNIVDCALVEPNLTVFSKWTPKIGHPTETVEAEVGDTMEKFGRTTEYTKGKVKSVDVSVRVRFSDGIREFDDQIMTEDMSDGGDSGSEGVIEGKSAGLLFAGSDKATFFNKMDNVLDELGVRLTP